MWYNFTINSIQPFPILIKVKRVYPTSNLFKAEKDSKFYRTLILLETYLTVFVLILSLGKTTVFLHSFSCKRYFLWNYLEYWNILHGYSIYTNKSNDVFYLVYLFF